MVYSQLFPPVSPSYRGYTSDEGIRSLTFAFGVLVWLVCLGFGVACVPFFLIVLCFLEHPLVAQQNEYWMGHDVLSLPSVLQINCGGLKGGALEGDVQQGAPLTFVRLPPFSRKKSCQKWEELDFGRATVLHGQTQKVLKAARFLQRTDGSHTQWSMEVALRNRLPVCCQVVFER